MSAGVGDAEARFRLYRFIDGSAGALRYVDAQEEENIFRKAESMGIWKGQAEAMLNHRCKRHKWTRGKGNRLLHPDYAREGVHAQRAY